MPEMLDHNLSHSGSEVHGVSSTRREVQREQLYKNNCEPLEGSQVPPTLVDSSAPCASEMGCHEKVEVAALGAASFLAEGGGSGPSGPRRSCSPSCTPSRPAGEPDKAQHRRRQVGWSCETNCRNGADSPVCWSSPGCQRYGCVLRSGGARRCSNWGRLAIVSSAG